MERKERFRLAYERLRKNGAVHTQKEIADRMEASRVTVNKALNGDELALTDRFLKRFNEAFGCPFSMGWLLTGEGEMEPEDDGQWHRTGVSVPLIPYKALGGAFNDFDEAVLEAECERVTSPIRGVDYAITISGDSMEPEYPNGSTVLIKRINERSFIEWGRAYVLNTVNGTVIKILTPSTREGYVRCVSANPDPIYAPFEVARSDIRAVYRVLLCMALK